ncbi:hypothetical protein GJAV_G00211480 [Gymnothorax javanicus]|nr:hypothetical protein GJAV_G00211480 [Gymnothorax javanicus]
MTVLGGRIPGDGGHSEEDGAPVQPVLRSYDGERRPAGDVHAAARCDSPGPGRTTFVILRFVVVRIVSRSLTENEPTTDMDQSEVVRSWFSHPVFDRYWQHYHQGMSWLQRHKCAYRRALAAYAFPPFPPPDPAAPPSRYSDWHAGEDVAAGRARSRVGQPSERTSRNSRPATANETDEEGTDSDSEIECDVSNMEITDELRQYFAQTEKHREELKKQQQMEAEQQGAYVLADRDLHRVSLLSAAPPAERPGERRGAEMKKLYGEDAAKIQAMEAAVQLCFDRNCDRKQPKYWPVIPLRL